MPGRARIAPNRWIIADALPHPAQVLISAKHPLTGIRYRGYRHAHAYAPHVTTAEASYTSTVPRETLLIVHQPDPCLLELSYRGPYKGPGLYNER